MLSASPKPALVEYKEDQPILLPLLEDGVVAIGDLWNCVDGKPCGLNLFGQELEATHLAAQACPTQEYTFDQLRNTKNKVDSIKVEASVTLELLKGKIKLDGGVTYDEKTNSNYNEEHLVCNYKLQKYSVRALPSAKERVDKYIKSLIISGKLKATHVCMELITGAETTANIYVKQGDSVNDRSISGHLEGSLKMGPITASAKVALTKLDTDNSSGLTKRIAVHSKPPLSNNPTTIAEMLTALEAITDRVENEKHFPMLAPKEVIGVPLRFRLVPITQFIDFKAEKKFQMMNEGVEEQFMDMMVTLKDFQLADYLKRQIVQKVRRLQTLLADVDNPLTKEIAEREKYYRDHSKALQYGGFLVYEKYKNGKWELGKPLQKAIENGETAKIKNLDEKIELPIETDLSNCSILDVVQKYKTIFDEIDIKAEIDRFCEEGKLQLAGVQFSDVSPESKVSFFSNTTDLKEWLSGERRIKLLINTEMDKNENPQAPHGSLLFLYDVSPHLHKLDIDVGVAYPNICKGNGFTMTLKGRDRQKVYQKDEILHALQVLATAVGKADPVSSKFYTVFGALTGIHLPLPKESLGDITSLIAALEEVKNVSICTSYLQLIERIKQEKERIQLVLSMDASDSIIDSVHFYKRLVRKFESTKKGIEWIVGTFALQNFHQAPLLFVFYQGNLVSLCLDNLDLQILLEKLETGDLRFDLLSPQKMTKGCLYPNRCNYGLQVAEILGQSTRSFTDSNIKLCSFSEYNNDELANAIKFTRAALTNNPVQIISQVASFCTDLFPELTPTLQKHGWNATMNVFTAALNKDKWAAVVKTLREFFSKYNPFFAKVEYAISRLKELKKKEKNVAIPSQKTDKDDPKISKENFKGEENPKVGEESKALEDPYLIVDSILKDEECKQYPDLEKSLTSFAGSGNRDIIISGAVTALQHFAENTEKNFKDASEISENKDSENAVEQEDANDSNDSTNYKDSKDIKFFYLHTLINLADKMADSEEALLSSVVEVARELINKIEVKFVKDSGIYEKLNDYLNRKSLYHTLSLLSKCQFDVKMAQVHQTFYSLQPFSQVEISKQVNSSFIENLEKYQLTKDQYKELWNNPKFQYLMLKNIKVPSFVEAIKMYQCKTEIPSHLPKELQAVIKPLMSEDVSNNFDWKKSWSTVEDFLQVLQAIAVREIIPDDFQQVYTNNLATPEVFSALEKVGVLFYWDNKEQYFTEPWDIRTVSMAIKLIMEKVEEGNEVDTSKLKLEPIISNAPDVTFPTETSLTNKWKPLGLIKNSIAFNDYRPIQGLQVKPTVELNELDQLLPQAIPYILQNLKMGNLYVLRPEMLNSFIEQNRDKLSGMAFGLSSSRISLCSNTSETSSSYDKKVPQLTRSDLLVLLSAIADGHVLRDILSKLTSGFYGALPLVVPEINLTDTKDRFPNGDSRGFTYTLMYPALKNLIIQWKAQQEALVGHLLFSDKFKLVVACRLGGKIRIGKTTILNELFDSTNCPHMFTSDKDCLSNGRALISGGLVELTWLTPTTCKLKLWSILEKYYYKTGNEDLLLLANLHGDANEYPQIVREMAKIGASFVTFLMPCHSTNIDLKINGFEHNLKSSRENITKASNGEALRSENTNGANITQAKISSTEDILIKNISSAENIFYFLVDPPTHCAAAVDKGHIIGSSENRKDIIHKLLRALLKLYSIKSKLWNHSRFEKPFVLAPSLNSSECLNKLVEYIKKLGVRKIKSSLQLQTLDLHNKDDVEDCLAKNGTVLSSILNMLVAVMTLPEYYRRGALLHLSEILNFLSDVATYKFKSQIINLKSQLKADADSVGMADLQSQIMELKETVEERSLTFDDIWREFFTALQLVDSTNKKWALWNLWHFIDGGCTDLYTFFETHIPLKVPKIEEISQNGSIKQTSSLEEEILQNGSMETTESSQTSTTEEKSQIGLNESTTVLTNKEILRNALNAYEVDSIIEKMHDANSKQVFVVSIIGLESSGKSTILNHLFGTKFPVGIAGCSKGLKMSLVYMKKDLREDLTPQAFLILDSEGVDPHADAETLNNQKILLAIAISLSNLVIINIQDNSFKYLSKSLETVMARILRRKTGKISTEFLLLQQGLVDSPKSSVPDDFLVLMNNLKTLEVNKLQAGLRVKATERFSNVCNRERIVESLFNVRKYKSAENGPTTEQFHEDVGALYENILKICQETEFFYSFGEWYQRFESLSQEITTDTFPLEYSSLHELQMHFDLEKKINNIKDAIDIAFSEHTISTLMPIIEKIRPGKKADEKIRTNCITEIKNKMRKVGFTCPDSASKSDSSASSGNTVQTQCEYCQTVAKLREKLVKQLQGSTPTLLYGVEKTLNSYINSVRTVITNAELQMLEAEYIRDKGIVDPKTDLNKVKAIPAGRLIEAEIEQCYPNLPEMVSELKSPGLPALSGIRAFDMPNEWGSAARKKAQLNWEQEDIIQAKMKDLPEAILQAKRKSLGEGTTVNKNIDIYQIGMVREVQAKLSEILSDFESQTRKKLIPTFLWTAHLYGIKYFYNFMLKKQNEWDEIFHPLKMSI